MKNNKANKFRQSGGRMIKYKGIAVSISPYTNFICIQNSSKSFTFMSAFVIFSSIFMIEEGISGECFTNPKTFITKCLNQVDSQTDKSIFISGHATNLPINVQTFQGFMHDTTHAIDKESITISNEGTPSKGITYIDKHNSEVKGSGTALSIINSNDGNILIDSNGQFTSNKSYGIHVENLGKSNIEININESSGNFAGIYLLDRNESIKSSIFTTGTISGTKSSGIVAVGSGGIVDIESIGPVSGKYGVITAGYYNPKITTLGDVTASIFDGVFATVSQLGHDLTINSHNVTAKGTGIVAANHGTGDTFIKTTGKVKGEEEIGILALHQGRNLTIQAKDVSGKEAGIEVYEYIGKGQISISSEENISGEEYGIDIDVLEESAGTNINVNDVSGGRNAILIKHNSSGDVNVVTHGNIEIKKAKDSSDILSESTIFVESKGNITVDVSGVVSSPAVSSLLPQEKSAIMSPLNSNSTPEGLANNIAIDLRSSDGSAILVLRDSGHVLGKSVASLKNETDKLVFSGNNATRRFDLSRLGAENTSSAIIGFDDFVKTDSGTLTLHGTQAHAAFRSAKISEGLVELDDAVLQLQGDSPNLEISSQSELKISGDKKSTVRGSVINDGIISMKKMGPDSIGRQFSVSGSVENRKTISMKDGYSGSRFVIGKNYASNGNNYLTEINSTILLEVNPSNNTLSGDKLTIEGDSHGETSVKIFQDSLGRETIDDDLLIEVKGKSDGIFTLKDGDFITDDGEPALISGAYAYTLDKVGKDWLLSSEIQSEPQKERRLQPAVPVALAEIEHLLFLSEPPTLYQRVGSRHSAILASSENNKISSSTWAKFKNFHSRQSQKTTKSINNVTGNKIGFGIDFTSPLQDSIQYVIGINGTLGKSSAKVESKFGFGNADTTHYGVGATGTVYFDNTYIDLQAQYNKFDSDLRTHKLGIIADNNETRGYAFSFESGYSINSKSKEWRFIPQAQLSYSKISSDSYVISEHNSFDAVDTDQMTLRLGSTLEHNISNKRGETHLYSSANIYRKFLDAPFVKVANVDHIRGTNDTIAEIILGGEYRIRNSKARLYGEFRMISDIENFGKVKDRSLDIGMNIQW